MPAGRQLYRRSQSEGLLAMAFVSSMRVCAGVKLATAALIIFIISGLPLVSHALTDGADCAPEETLRVRGGTFRLENDLVANTDQNYTNGVALTVVSRDFSGRPRPECLPAPVRLHALFIKFANPGFWAERKDQNHSWNVVARMGQDMYTPEDPARSDLIVDDRPYAGLLYFGLAWNRRSHQPGSRWETLDVRELTLGIIGPWAMAEKSQNAVHDFRHTERFMGWHHQLRNEPAFKLSLERKFRPWANDGAIQPGWGTDVIGNYAVHAGNIQTAASAGLVLRGGWNVPNDFGSYPISPGAESRPPSAAAQLRSQQSGSAHAPRPGIHAFLNLEAKAVVWDFSLDGNLVRNSHSIRRRPWVAQMATGISSQWLVRGRGVRLALMRVWRTREFDGQSNDHVFGSLALSFEF